MKKIIFGLAFVLIISSALLVAQESENPFLGTTWVVEMVGGRSPMAFEFYADGTYKQASSLVYKDLQDADPMTYRINVQEQLIEMELREDMWVEWSYEFGMDGQRYFDLYFTGTDNPFAQQYVAEFEQGVGRDEYNDLTQDFFSAMTESLKEVILNIPFMRGFEPAG